MKRYTKAAFLQDEGTETPVFVRFSTVVHSQHSPTQLLAICNFYRADAALGQQLADNLKVDITPYIKQFA